MLGAALDPFGGSFVVLAAIGVAAFATWRARSNEHVILFCALGLTAMGVTALWGLTMVGGFGGDTGRSNLWWFSLVPYPLGWLLALYGVSRTLWRPQAV